MSAPPYPADVRARGWTFCLDVERIEQSDTWTIAPAELRPWLLMLWMKAWTAVPSGSLVADSRLIAGRIGMELALFERHRDILLRGWWEADDGRLYHPVLTELVEQMRDGRKRDRVRKARQREAEASVPSQSRGTPSGVPRDSTRSPTGVPLLDRDQDRDQDRDRDQDQDQDQRRGRERHADSASRPTRVRSSQSITTQDLVLKGVDQSVAVDFLSLRERRRAPLTLTAFRGIEREARVAGMTVEQVLRKCVERGWQGFEATWLQGQTSGGATVPGTGLSAAGEATRAAGIRFAERLRSMSRGEVPGDKPRSSRE